MTFNSLSFLLFFAFCIVVYECVAQRHKWKALLLFSLVFYSFAGLNFFPYFIVTATSSYLVALRIDFWNKHTGDDDRDLSRSLGVRTRQKLLLVANLLVNFGMLFYLKYFNFFATEISAILNLDFAACTLLLPLGISFYVFQSMGYCIDVYRNLYCAQRNFLKLLLFVIYFPQIINGPINRYNEMSDSLYNPQRFDYERCKQALVLFAWGLFKKVLVADNIKFLVDTIFNNYQEHNGMIILCGGLAYAIYIYADFSGCIDMARGVSRFFGIEMARNFNLPYFSMSIADFWRRWHMTLCAWFRDYLFYPLLRAPYFVRVGKTFRNRGNKKMATIAPTTVAILIVWLVTGLWHGANFTYLLWGGYYGVLLSADLVISQYRRKNRSKPKAIVKAAKMFVTFFLVCIGYIIFNASSAAVAVQLLKQLFNMRGLLSYDSYYLVYTAFSIAVGRKIYFWLAVLATVIFVGVDILEANNISLYAWINRRSCITRYVVYVCTAMLLLFMMNRSSGDFTYMKF